jgi:hypothetical protein
MPKAYNVFVNFECLESLPRAGRYRQALVRFIRGLGEIAHLGGDFQVVDPASARRFEVSIVSGFAVTWWIDGPAYEVKVVDIRTVTR